MPYLLLSLLWGEECIPNDNTTEASTSRNNVPDESNFKGRQHRDIAWLLEIEGHTHNDMGPSTSKHHKPSWCRHPSRDSETDSNEYKWDTLSEESSIRDI